MYVTILKWLAVASASLAIIGVPFWYVGKVETEAYNAGVAAATAECAKNAADAALRAEENHLTILKDEASKAKALAAELAKQRQDAKTLKGKLDEALSKQPEATGCVLTGDAADILRFAAEGDFDAAAQQDASVSRAHVDQVPGEFAVPDSRQTNHSSGIGRNLLLGR